MSQTLGFVGVGRMGGPMALRLLDAGHSLCVFDTNDDVVKPLTARGAAKASSAEDVASKAEVVFLSLPTPPVVQAMVAPVIAVNPPVDCVLCSMFATK